MFGVQTLANRLIVVRFPEEIELPFALKVAQDVRAAIIALGGVRFVAISDLRITKTFSTQVEEVLFQLLRADNPLVERSAILIGAGRHLATSGLRVWRMIQEVGNPARRAFKPHELNDALGWLAEVSSPEAQAAARTFVNVDLEKIKGP